MDAGSLWAMITARSIAGGGQGHDYGGITPDDVRGALQHLRPGPYRAAMFIRCGDSDSLTDLRMQLWTAIKRLSRHEGWQAHKVTVKKCTECGGTGSLKVSGQLIVCHHCGGRGQITKGRIDTLLGNLVILDHCIGRQCAVCGGNGLIQVDVQARHCELCGGRGRVRLREKDKAEYTDMSRENWSRYWSKRYNACYQIIEDWLDSADRHVGVRVKDERLAS